MAASVNIADGGSNTNTGSQPSDAHQLFTAFAGELIGIAVLAVFADMSDDIGKVAVAIMAGWFLIFLIANATDLSGLIGRI